MKPLWPPVSFDHFEHQYHTSFRYVIRDLGHHHIFSFKYLQIKRKLNSIFSLRPLKPWSSKLAMQKSSQSTNSGFLFFSQTIANTTWAHLKFLDVTMMLITWFYLQFWKALIKKKLCQVSEIIWQQDKRFWYRRSETPARYQSNKKYSNGKILIWSSLQDSRYKFLVSLFQMFKLKTTLLNTGHIISW